MPHPKGFAPWCWTAAVSAARPGPPRGSRITWAFPPAFPGLALMARAYNQAQKFGAEISIPEEARLLKGRGENGARFEVRLGNGESVKARSRGPGLRRALSPAGHSQPLRFRRHLRALLGQRHRNQAVRRPGGRACRSRQFGRPGGCLPGRQGQEALDDRARQKPGRHHVAISDRPHPGAAQCRGAAAHARSAAWKAGKRR